MFSAHHAEYAKEFRLVRFRRFLIMNNPCFLFTGSAS